MSNILPVFLMGLVIILTIPAILLISSNNIEKPQKQEENTEIKIEVKGFIPEQSVFGSKPYTFQAIVFGEEKKVFKTSGTLTDFMLVKKIPLDKNYTCHGIHDAGIRWAIMRCDFLEINPSPSSN